MVIVHTALLVFTSTSIHFPYLRRAGRPTRESSRGRVFLHLPFITLHPWSLVDHSRTVLDVGDSLRRFNPRISNATAPNSYRSYQILQNYLSDSFLCPLLY